MTKMLGLAIGVCGVAATFFAANAFGMWDQFFDLAILSAAIALLLGALGAFALFWLRRSPIGVQVSLSAMVCVAGVGVGAVVAADRMFLSEHDLQALLIILIASATAGLLTAVALGRRVSKAGLAVRDATRRLGDGHIPDIRPHTNEFANLAHELKETSIRLEEARAGERASEASRRELIAWISHDLRTPLAGIKVVAEALEDGIINDDPGVRRDYYKTLSLETDRLSGLVDDLFELSRITAGALQLRPEPTSLEDLVSDSLAATAPLAHKKGIKLDGRVVEGSRPIELSIPEMARALRNVIQNAVHHTPTKGMVWVEAGSDDQEAYISVKDECGGIPPDDIERVFDLAFRGHPARTPRDDVGAGLGLAIAKGIVEAHRGEISVVNQDGGCRFTLRLPVVAAPDAPA